MISTKIPKVVHNHGHDFLKRLYPAGVYCFYHRYRPAPCLYISPRPGRMAEWAQLQPLPCMILTKGSSVCGSSSRPRQIKIHRHILHTPSSFIFFHLSIVTHTQMENFKQDDPWRHPHKLVVNRDPIRPTDGSTLGLGSKRRELAPRGMNEAKNHLATMATHPSLLAN